MQNFIVKGWFRPSTKLWSHAIGHQPRFFIDQNEYKAMLIGIIVGDAALEKHLVEALTHANHVCLTFGTDREFLSFSLRETVDVLLLDWNLRTFSPVQTIGLVKAMPNPLPIAVLASGKEPDIVTALEAGADDYIVKPISSRVLLAKLEALRRRSDPTMIPGWSEHYGAYAFQNVSHAVQVHGQTVSLRPKEFALARMLFRNLNKQLSRTYLLDALWAGTPGSQTRTLDAHVSSIRRRLHLRAENGFRLVTLYGLGYRLEETPQ